MGNKSSKTGDLNLDWMRLTREGGNASLQSYVSVAYTLTEMKENPNSQIVQDAGMEVLQNLLEEDDASTAGNTIHESGGTNVILAAMKLFPKVAEIQRNGCQILTALAEMGLSFKTKSTEAIVEAMEHHTQDLFIVSRAIAALFQLTLRHPKNQAVMGKSGGIAVLVSIMNRHIEHGLIQEMAIALLYLAARQKCNWPYLSQSSTMAAIFCAMMEFPLREETQVLGRLLFCLLVTNQYNKTRGLGRSIITIDPLVYAKTEFPFGHDNEVATIKFTVTSSGLTIPKLVPVYTPSYDMRVVVKDIERSMMEHQGKIDVQMTGLVALLYLTATHRPGNKAIYTAMADNSLAVSIQAAGCMALMGRLIFHDRLPRCSSWPHHLAIAKVLSQNKEKGDAFIQMAALTTMTAFAKMNDIEMAFSANELQLILESILTSMATYSGDVGIQIQSCQLLKYLLEDTDMDVDLSFVVPAVASAMQNHSDNFACQMAGIDLLSTRAVYFGEYSDLQLVGAFDTIMAAVEKYEGMGEMAGDGLFLLLRISCGSFVHLPDHNQQKRGIHFLLRLLSNSASPAVHKGILGTLWNLITKCGMTCVQYFLEANGDIILKKMVESTTDFVVQLEIIRLLHDIREYQSSDAIELALKDCTRDIVTLVSKGEVADDMIALSCAAVAVAVKTLNPEVHYRAVLVEAGILEAMILSVKAGEGDETYDWYALDIIKHFSSDKSNRDRIAGAGGISAMVMVMKRHKQSADVQNDGFGFLMQMSDSPVFALAIMKAGGFSAILSVLLNFHRGDKDIQARAFRVLLKLVVACIWQAWLWRVCSAMGGH